MKKKKKETKEGQDGDKLEQLRQPKCQVKRHTLRLTKTAQKKMTVLLIKSGIYRDEQQRDFHCKQGGPTSLKHNSKGLTGHSRFHSY